MVGRSLDTVYPHVPHVPGVVLLTIAGLSGAPLPTAASLELRRGEIVGVAGLVGAGRSELLRTLFGLAPVMDGSVTIGFVTDRGAGVRARIAQGLGLVSEDRKDEGLALTRSVAENLTLSNHAPFTRFGWLWTERRARATARWVEELSVKVRATDQPVGELSGGNQQKIAIARLLHQDADVLLLDEPTRGIDVGSKVEVYRLIGELAAEGKAILLVSSYVPELLGICDRIAVMHRGQLGEARARDEWTDVELLDVATRGHGARGAA